MDTFGDPGWFHHQQIAQLWGLISLRLATATIIPFNATAYTSKLEEYLKSLEDLSDEVAESGVHAERFSLHPLKKSIRRLTKYARKLDSAAAELRLNPSRRICYFNLICRDRSRHKEVEEINEAYMKFERGFIGKGLPGRPIYKHIIYAPGTWEGYTGVTFPSIREAITEGQWKETKEQIKEISELLEKASSKPERRKCT